MVSKRKEQLLKERTQRVREAVALKEPDRVPITIFADMFLVAHRTGMTYSDALYKPFRGAKHWINTFSQYDWDVYPAYFVPTSAKLNDAVEHKMMKWPGAKNPENRLGDYQPFQYVENEWMSPDEYEDFITDMTGFLLRKVIPRQNPGLAAFSKLPTSNLLTLFGPLTIPMYFMEKDVQKMLKKLKPLKTIMAMIGSILGQNKYNKVMRNRGNPVAHMPGIGMAPFDIISDSIRGMRGTMLDMRRHPEELKKACDILANQAIQSLGSMDAMFGEADEYCVSMSFIPLHRGADGFMSNEQFEQFYWPSLTKIMEAMIEKGYTPMPFFEGYYDQRLPYLADFAKKHPGKMVYWFHNVDMKKAKEMMGDKVCIRGNIPASLLIGGTPQQMDDYVKQVIEDCKEGGGFLVDGGVSGMPNESRHENMVAMTNAVHKYGVYRQ